MNSLAVALVDKREKLSRIVTALAVAGAKVDTTRPEIKDRKISYPHTASCLSMVRYGIYGPTLEEIALLLEDTSSLDGGRK